MAASEAQKAASRRHFNCNWAKYHEGECRCQGPALRVIEGGG